MATTIDKPATGVIRKARTADVPAMQRLINGFAEQDLMLHRGLAELYENIRDYFVVEEEDEIAGCCGLHVSWKDLAEIKSLAVAEHHQGHGHGRRLIEACINEADGLGVFRVFALTYVPELFEKLGFVRADRSLLPRKVWTECVHCPKFHDCHEIAVIHDRPAVGADIIGVAGPNS